MSVHSPHRVLLLLELNYATLKESLAPENRICRIHEAEKTHVSTKVGISHTEEPWGLG